MKSSQFANQSMTKYDSLVTAERLTVSLAAELAAQIREAATLDGQNVSSWLAVAAQRRLATQGLAEVVSEWEAIHGSFSDEELATARNRLTQ